MGWIPGAESSRPSQTDRGRPRHVEAEAVGKERELGGTRQIPPARGRESRLVGSSQAGPRMAAVGRRGSLARPSDAATAAVRPQRSRSLTRWSAT